jgi:oxygen-independent coproporphyrinogen-3 oxidase
MAEDARMSPVIFNDALQALDTLAKDGLVYRDGWIVLVPEIGRPFLRNVAACFDAYLNMTDSSRATRHSAAI